MKNILLIATGGTIASKSTESGFMPLISSEEILECIPEVRSFCQITAIQLMNLDSTNIGPEHWIMMEMCIMEHYDQYDGFVIAHGTDTMAYSAAGLSYLLQNSKKPVVFTGAQKSIYMADTDAKRNLKDAILFAADKESHGVHIIFDGKAIIGTRARKIRTKSFHAFSSIDFPETAVVREGKIIRYIRDIPYTDRPLSYHVMNPKVFLLKLIPGTSANIFQYLKKDYDAVIIEGFGVGGIPQYEKADFLQAMEEWVVSGKTLVMTTQVPYEGSDLTRYQVGFHAKETLKAMEAYTMTLEATVTKLMWILGQTKDPEEIQRLFYKPISFDII